MNPPIPKSFQKDVDELPPALRRVLDSELKAGNEITELAHSHPAPPFGCYILLKNAVTTQPRESNALLKFRRANSSLYSGMFSDAVGHYFILEPPQEANASYPDMDAIREASNKPRPNVFVSSNSDVADRFRKSMQVDYEMWHDGTGYKLELLADATEADLKLIVPFLVPPNGWRDVEALAAIDLEIARDALHKALKSGKAEVRTAVTRYAPWIANDKERTELLIRALDHGKFYDDLTSALAQVEKFHPPAIVNALFRGLFVRPGEIATHFAAMLTFVHGKAESSFDWDKRPLFLKFNSDDGAERQAAFIELCALLDVQPSEVMARIEQ